MKENKSQKIIIPLQDGYKLIAEQNTDVDHEKEIMIGILDPDNIWHQDLAVVRNAYVTDNNFNVQYIENKYDVCVYADKSDEDYTHKFVIDLFKEKSE